MRTRQANSFSRRHFAWLLWLVLLVPLGQTAATWHLLSHVLASETADNKDDGNQAIHLDRCDLDLSAATVIGGAPLITGPDMPRATACIDAPLLALHGVFSTAFARAYDSQAPPFSTH